MIRSEKSIFQYDEIVILRYSCQYIDPGAQQELQIQSIMDQYEVDVDFGFAHKQLEKKIMAFCKISVNQPEKPLPGYSLFAEAVNVFDDELGTSLPKERFVKEIQIPAVSHTISFLRNYILTATAPGPFGKYQVPLISLAHLFKAKVSQFGIPKEETKKQKPPQDRPVG